MSRYKKHINKLITEKLNNGLTIKLYSKESYLVGINFTVLFGIYDVKYPHRGLPHFIEHLLLNGSKNYSNYEVNKKVITFGGHLKAKSIFHTDFYTNIVYKGFTEIIHLFLDIIFNPKFTDEIIEKEKKIILEEQRGIRDNIEKYIKIKFLENLYINHPLSWDGYTFGNIDTINNFSKKIVREYYDKYYRPDKIIVSVVGDIDNEKAFNLLSKKDIISKMPDKSEKYLDYNFNTNISRNKVIIEEKKLKNAHILIGYRAPSGKNLEHLIMELINCYLSAYYGSKLWYILRIKERLLYKIKSEYIYYIDQGYYYIYAVMQKENINKVIKIIKNEINKLCENGINNTELEMTKNYLINRYLFIIDDNVNLCKKLVEDEIFQRELNYNKFVKLIKNISNKDIKNVAQQYLNESIIIIFK